MINYLSASGEPSAEVVDFWLMELRSPVLLMEASQRFPAAVDRLKASRILLESASDGNEEQLRRALVEEMEAEKAADRLYWDPLKRKLSEIRRRRS